MGTYLLDLFNTAVLMRALETGEMGVEGEGSEIGVMLE
jgi:hypothetical protein